MVTHPHGNLPRRPREHFSKAWRLLACGVPNARLAEVHIDVGVAFECRAQGDECGPCVRWGRMPHT